jgi:hypothetical protein
LFETGPFLTCPLCKTAEAFGIQHIGGNRVVRRCRKCGLIENEQLPQLSKQVIYLDQFAFSELFKCEAGIRNPEAPSGDFWATLSAKVRRVVMLQQAIFPTSDIHSTETLVAKNHMELKAAAQRIGGDATLIDTRDVEFMQTFECFEAYREKREPTFDLSVDKVVKGRRNVWLPAMRIVANTDYSVFADAVRKIVNETADEVEKLIALWVEKQPIFEQALEHELSSYSFGKKNAWLEQMSQFERLVADDSLDWLNAAGHPIMREFSELRRAFERAGFAEDEACREVIKFWEWEKNREQPHHRVGSYIFAALARKVVAGQKSVTRGFANDVRAISSYSPYIDAMFVDRECAALMSELEPQLKTRARIFSMRDRDEFLAYLDEIEQNTPDDIRRTANGLYQFN